MTSVQSPIPFRPHEEAFWRTVYNTSYTSMLYVAFRLLNHSEDAKDLVSDAFIKTYINREQFSDITGVKNYFFITVRNNCFHHLRNEAKTRAALAELALLEEKTVELYNDALSVEEFILAELNALAASDRDLLRMFYQQGKTIPQIARELNRTENGVRVQKSNALQKIRNRLPSLSDVFELLIILILSRIDHL